MFKNDKLIRLKNKKIIKNIKPTELMQFNSVHSFARGAL